MIKTKNLKVDIHNTATVGLVQQRFGEIGVLGLI